MDAKDWLKLVEKKLDIAKCSDREKVLFVGHQLFGTAADWCETYHNNWNEFKAELTMYPAALTRLRRGNFLTWTSGV
jgi:hypothetical protein